MQVGSGSKQLTAAVVPGESTTQTQAQPIPPAAGQPSGSASAARAGLPPRPTSSNSSSPPAPPTPKRKGLFSAFRKAPAIPDITKMNRDGVTALVQAIIEGKTAYALQMLEQSVSKPQKREQHDSTLRLGFYEAALQGNMDILKALSETEGLEWNTSLTGKGETALHAAVWGNHIEVVKLLLEGKRLKNPRVDNNGCSALHFAAQFSDPEIFKLLLETKAFDCNETTLAGATPLHFAAKNGKTGIVSLLLEQHNIDYNAKHTNGDTALILAAKRGRTAIAGLLLTKEDLELNVRGAGGDTALNHATKRGDTDFVKLLIEKSCIDFNLSDNDGVPPLSAAIINNHFPVFTLLLAQEQVNCCKRDNRGLTPLYHSRIIDGGWPRTDDIYFEALLERKDLSYGDSEWAKNTGKVSLLEDLKSRGQIHRARLVERREKSLAVSNPNTIAEDGKTLLMRAIEQQETTKIAPLLKHAQFNPNLADKDGRTALFYAAKLHDIDTARTLLARNDTEVNKPTQKGASPLHIAVQNGHLDIVKMLLAHKDVDVNPALRDSGNTPLFQAAANGQLDITAALLERLTINCNKTTTDGASPLHIAAANGHIEIVRLLAEREELDFDQRFDGKTAIAAAKTPAIAMVLQDARSMAAIRKKQAIPFDGPALDLKGINTREQADGAVDRWLRSPAVPRRDLERLRVDIDAYTKTATMSAYAFNTRYKNFFASGFAIEDPDARKRLVQLWKSLPTP